MRYRAWYPVLVIQALACSGDELPTAPPAEYPFSPGWVTICLEMSGTDLDGDGCHVWMEGDYYGGALLADGRCSHLETNKYARNIHIDDVAPNCTPTAFVEVEQTMYIPVDEPWGYHLGRTEHLIGDTTSYPIHLVCEPRPEVPTGPFHFTAGGTCGADSLTVVLDGTAVFTIAADSTFHPADEFLPAHWARSFRGFYDVPEGDYRLEWTGLPEGTVACDSYDSCWTSRWIQIRYGKLTHVHAGLRCPT